MTTLTRFYMPAGHAQQRVIRNLWARAQVLSAYAGDTEPAVTGAIHNPRDRSRGRGGDSA